ncbi:MAG: SPOR domain-containing protein, partial [Betaproteobacteria bacterium]|nr:SPOR domain-containing protein [Betaproteobacteria bacterium]
APAKPSVAPRIETAAETISETQPESESEPGEFRIQMVALSDQQKAEDFAADLSQLLGIDAHTEATEREGEPLYRVWLGPFASREAAATALAEFSAADRDGSFDFAAAQIRPSP